jgi:hypothetical protein
MTIKYCEQLHQVPYRKERLPHGTYDTIIKMRRKGRRKEGEKEGFETPTATLVA